MATAQATRALRIIVVDDDTGDEIGRLLAPAKQFSTGSRGYYANGKLDLDTDRLQCGFTLTIIGSKPKA